MGARVVAIAGSRGAVYAKDGFPILKVEEVIKKKLSLLEAFPKNVISDKAFWHLPVDVLIPASVTDVINDSNKKGIQASIIVEGGNIPMREPIEEELHHRGVLIIPDFVANAGGVISSYAEYRGYGHEKMLQLVEEKIVRSTSLVLKRLGNNKKSPRTIGMEIAKEIVEQAMKKRKKTFA
jgi:glutamate dehydrogenase (NAD(P)+)